MQPKRVFAIRLRKQGRTYREVSRTLGGIPKSTLSGWLKDCRLTKADRQRLMSRNQSRWAESLVRYNKRRALIARQKSEIELSSAAAQIRDLTQHELWLVGVALYWAEGQKGARWRLKFSNSDPTMVKLMMRFFREICRVPEGRFSAQLHLHPHVSESRAKVFWRRITKIPQRQFVRSQHVLSRSSNGKRPHHRLPYGTFHVAICDTPTRNRVMGWIEGLGRSN